MAVGNQSRTTERVIPQHSGFERRRITMERVELLRFAAENFFN